VTATGGAHGRHVAVVGRQHQREVAGGGRSTAASPCARGHVLSGTCGHGPLWAAGKRALPLKLFPKIQNHHKFLIQIGDLPDVQNSPNFISL
jgi:hypothetical protein